tara:strand:- start:679 stop:1044 length:366 start_codon:yes stop_codon:yes gene_type:complete
MIGALEARSVSLRIAARLVVAVCLFGISWGTLAGSSPSWPDKQVYALLAFLTGLMWLAAAVSDRRSCSTLSEAALLALALIRGSGYALDLVTSGDATLLAAVGAWSIICVLSAVPLLARSH